MRKVESEPVGIIGEVVEYEVNSDEEKTRAKSTLLIIMSLILITTIVGEESIFNLLSIFVSFVIKILDNVSNDKYGTGSN